MKILVTIARTPEQLAAAARIIARIQPYSFTLGLCKQAYYQRIGKMILPVMSDVCCASYIQPNGPKIELCYWSR